jgi:hypothetical protein
MRTTRARTVECMNRNHLISLLTAAVAASLALAPTASAEEAQPPPPPEFHADSTIETTGAGAIKPGPQRMQAEGAAGGICYGKQLTRSEGGWPYGRRLYNYTVWCASGGRITYRSTAAWTSHDFLCWNDGGPYVARTAGGVGWSYVQVQVWVNVACHSPWWFDWHDTLMMRVNYYPNGVYHTVAWD